jgi:proteasome assembly chaperone (PAC2) family protein
VARELRIYERPTSLERPVLIAAFRGWNDGGQAATLAVGYLARLWGARKFADIDPELFVDFQATRPMVSLEDGRTRKIEWPENSFFRGRIPGADRDAILLVGVEPNYRWRTFSEIVTELARDLGVELAVTLGALVADVPHTRASPVTGAATDPQLVDELGLQLSRYEGPTGIVGVLLDSCRRAGIPSVSLWAAVPHYVQLAPSPPAAKALCERLAGVLSTTIDVSELDEASEEYVEQVSQAVATDADTASYVEDLERRSDSLELLEESDDIVSGDALAAEISRFLREREADGDSPESGGDG